jgi:hypothetical protein
MAGRAPLQRERVRYQKKGWVAWSGLMEIFEDYLTLKADMTVETPERIPFNTIVSLVTREEKVPIFFGLSNREQWRVLIDTNIGTHWEIETSFKGKADLVSNAYEQWKKAQGTSR